MMKETLDLKPISITKQHLNTIYKSVETSLNITLSVKGKIVIRRDINHYLLLYNNINEVLEYFKNYKENLKKLYLGYSDEAFINVISHLYR